MPDRERDDEIEALGEITSLVVGSRISSKVWSRVLTTYGKSLEELCRVLEPDNCDCGTCVSRPPLNGTKVA